MVIRDLHDPEYIWTRIQIIHQGHLEQAKTREQVRAVLRGGRSAVKALLGNDTKLKDQYLPTVNLMHTNMTRLAQKLGHVPDPKVDPPVNDDNDKARRKAGETEYVIESLDIRDRLHMKLPWWGRWLPAYGYAAMFVRPAWDPTAEAFYPKLQLPSSYDVFPGWWGPDQDPKELVVTRQVPVHTMASKYEDFAGHYQDRKQAYQKTGAAGLDWMRQKFGMSLSSGSTQAERSHWEGSTSLETVVVHEYHDITGRYLFCQDTGRVYDAVPNTLSVQPFIVARRFDFEDLTGHFDHMIGLMSMMTKLNILGYIAIEDDVFAPTNIIGDPTNRPYRKGRGTANRFPVGTTIQRGAMAANAQQTFMQIDRIERQARIQGNYPVSEDGQSPNSFATARGVQELGGSFNDEVSEYHRVISDAMERLDAIRLEMDDQKFGETAKPLHPRIAARAGSRTYTPKTFIKGRYSTRRVYGMMAGWDDPTKIVSGLQLLQAEVIDRDTFRENLYGLDNHQRIKDRIASDKAFDVLLTKLENAALNEDPTALEVLVQIIDNPSNKIEILREYYVPDEDEEQALDPLAEALAAGGGGQLGGPPASVSTVLSQLGQGGEIKGGIQTVGRL